MSIVIIVLSYTKYLCHFFLLAKVIYFGNSNIKC